LQAAIDATASGLQQLEQLLPGSCARLLCEAMLQLSVNEQPSLVKLHAAAASMFGGSATDGPEQQRSKQQQQQQQQQKLPQISEVEQPPPPMQQQQQQRKMEQLGLGSSPAAGLLGKQRPFAGAGGGLSGLNSSSNSSGGAAANAAAAAGLPGVGQLGPLGSYLMARWREDATRSAAAAAQGHH
jgi:hypothetical protein